MNQINTHYDTSHHESSWFIFNPVFLIRTVALALQEVDADPRYGMYTCGDKGIDRALQKRQVEVHRNISDMAIIMDRGFPLGIANPMNAREIYEYTQNHLEQWGTVLERTMHQVQAPLDDLMVLERFAAAVWHFARHQYAEGSAAGTIGMFQGMGSFAGLTEAGGLISLKTPTPEAKVGGMAGLLVQDNLPQRKSYADAIINCQARAFT